MLDKESGAHGEAGIAGRGLDIGFLKRCFREDFPIGDAIKRYPAGETDGFLLRALVQLAQQIEVDLFQARLHGRGDVVMAPGYGLGGRARSPHAPFEVFREHAAELGGLVGFAPSQFWSGAVVTEVIEAQGEARAAVGPNDALKFVEEFRLSVRGEPHHFVFVAKFPKPEVLRERCVIHPQRMRESDRSVHVEPVAGARSPHGAGKISQAIGGKHGSVLEGRNEKSARQVSLVVLDAMEFRPNRLGIGAEGLRQ